MPAQHEKTIEVRFPLHGFVTIRDWEREIINHPAYQRLRRIRQLAWTDQVYPGAMHTRFEHSLGVMHVASRMFDSITQNSRELLRDELKFNDGALERDKMLVRLTALLHDVGHSPFSHASEELFPVVGGVQLEHEDYSAEIIRRELKDVINGHPDSSNYSITADHIAAMLDGDSSEVNRSLIWRDLVSGQLDADRIDYLLRDSLHAGVDYGKFDWRRLIRCLVFVQTGEGQAHRIGLTEGGLHAAEGLVLARYFMFTQVYFHKTRRAYDTHLLEALKEILPGEKWPMLGGSNLKRYLDWDDWKVLGKLSAGKGGEHGKRLCTRDHYRMIYQTPEIPTKDDISKFERVQDKLGDLVADVAKAGKTWYKIAEDQDIPIRSENADGAVLPLSVHSAAVRGLEQTGRMMLYCVKEDKPKPLELVRQIGESE